MTRPVFLAALCLLLGISPFALGQFTGNPRFLQNAELTVPLNLDLEGTWHLQNPNDPPETFFPNGGFDRPAFYISQNTAMLGRDYFRLKRTGSSERFNGTQRTIHYQGTLYHHHALHDAIFHTNKIEQTVLGIDATLLHNCRVFPIHFELKADLTLHFAPDTRNLEGLAVRITGRATNEVEVGHFQTFTFAWDNHWRHGPYPGVNFFQDFAGDKIFLRSAHTIWDIFEGPDRSAEPCGYSAGESFDGYSKTHRNISYSRHGNLTYPRSTPTTTRHPLFWVRGPGPTPASEVGVIQGFARDRLNSIEIKRGAAILVRQNRPLREQSVTESGDAYRAYFQPHISIVSQVRLGPGGIFRFDNVPLVEKLDGAGGWVSPLYGVVIRGAEGDNTFSPGTPVIAYREAARFNLLPKVENAPTNEIPLQAISAIAAKRDVATNLVQLSKNNYAPVEFAVLEQLALFENGTITLSSEKEEGIKRAVWAEKIVHEGSLQAQDIIDQMCKNMAAVTSDLLGKLLGKLKGIGAKGDDLNKELAAANPQALKIEEDFGLARFSRSQ
ncbi:MAG TPA: hypothetical protein VEH27_16265 [Methylomirabilota bacterium]|nr:hypothetical protein [Methylomirabilota bacterium]